MSVPIPLPRVAAFEKLGFGMFVHWGLYSQLEQGEWTQSARNLDGKEYEKLQQTFTAADFNARELARTAKNAGMKYITLTTRHHEGFSLYDTCGLNTFDAPHSAAGRDLVREFVDGCRAEGIIPFFYHTTLDWHWHGKKTQELDQAEFDEYLDYLYRSVEILCSNYGKIGGLWFDGNWSRPNSDWKEERLYKMIHRLQPDAMVINNTGLVALGQTGNEEIDSVTFENNPSRPVCREGMKKYVAAEVCKTMNSHWGRSRLDFNYLSPKQLIEWICRSRGTGANLLMNIGPSAQGGVPAYEKAVLDLAGKWMSIFGEAIYNGKPVPGMKCQGRDFLLQDGPVYYYVAFDSPMGGDLNVVAGTLGFGPRCVGGFDRKIVSAKWMNDGEDVTFIQDAEKKLLTIQCDPYPYGTDLVVRILRLETC